MSDFNPGDGWREVTKHEWGYIPSEDDFVIEQESGCKRYWVRVPAVPPLPTDLYTVIRVTWAESPHAAPSDWVKFAPGYWDGRFGYCQSDEELQRRITGWEPLAEPGLAQDERNSLNIQRVQEVEQARRVTAKAVLDRVRGHENDPLWKFRITLDTIARDFGVKP